MNVGTEIDDTPIDTLAILRSQFAPAGSPGAVWMRARYERGRASICRALHIDRSEPTAAYATLPFAIVEDEEGETQIAGAIGIYPAFSVGDWTSVDISDVILWSPRTNRVRIMGEARSASCLVLPAIIPTDRLAVYGDGFAFFRAWADNRAYIAALAVERAKGKWVHGVIEPADSGIPGALAIGDLNKMRIADIDTHVLVAGPGIDAAKLKSALFRSANLPRVESPSYLRSAA